MIKYFRFLIGYIFLITFAHIAPADPPSTQKEKSLEQDVSNSSSSEKLERTSYYDVIPQFMDLFGDRPDFYYETLEHWIEEISTMTKGSKSFQNPKSSQNPESYKDTESKIDDFLEDIATQKVFESKDQAYKIIELFFKTIDINKMKREIFFKQYKMAENILYQHLNHFKMRKNKYDHAFFSPDETFSFFNSYTKIGVSLLEAHISVKKVFSKAKPDFLSIAQEDSTYKPLVNIIDKMIAYHEKWIDFWKEIIEDVNDLIYPEHSYSFENLLITRTWAQEQPYSVLKVLDKRKFKKELPPFERVSLELLKLYRKLLHEYYVTYNQVLKKDELYEKRRKTLSLKEIDDMFLLPTELYGEATEAKEQEWLMRYHKRQRLALKALKVKNPKEFKKLKTAFKKQNSFQSLEEKWPKGLEILGERAREYEKNNCMSVWARLTKRI